MALRYWITGGTGNWNSNTNWSTTSGGASGSTFPTVSDDVIFDANSGSGTCTLNIATGNAISFNGSAFTGTYLLVGNQLVLTGNFTLGSNMIFTGTSGSGSIVLSTSSIRTNGCVIGCTVFASGGNKIYLDDVTVGVDFRPSGTHTATLNGDMYINRDFSVLAGGITYTTNGGNIYLKRNFNEGLSAIAAGTSTLHFVSTTDQTWIGDNPTTTGTLRLNTIINPTGTLSILGAVRYGVGTLRYSGGTISGNSSTILALTSACNLDLSGNSIQQLSFASSGVFNLNSDLVVNNNLVATVPTAASKSTIKSNIVGTPRKLTLLHGATQDIDYVNFLDIDAGDAQTIWTYNPTAISGSTNILDMGTRGRTKIIQ